jgi:hypothetical protein
MKPRRLLLACLALFAAQMITPPARALCGFYAGSSGTPLLSTASKVVLAHHDGRTVLTLVSNYQGALEEFALVVPVPEVLEPGQVHIAEHALVDHLDAYTAPRLVERSDRNPCSAKASAGTTGAPPAGTAVHGVRIEAQQSAGEYDIAILSAEQSAGLARWLRQNGYRLPDGAEATLAPYIESGMRFLVARVNLEEQTKLGYSYLRPLQIAYESDELALPIRLGMLNADGPQELLVLALTRNGRLEPSNYRTIAIPSDLELPLHIAKDPAAFYDDLFETLLAEEAQPAVFLEYASQINACDPCAATPMSFDELRQLGAPWILDDGPVPAAALRTRCSSRAFTCAMTPRPCCMICAFTRPKTGAAFRVSTSCVTPGSGRRAARRPSPTSTACRGASRRRRRHLHASPGGHSPTSARAWREPASPSIRP